MKNIVWFSAIVLLTASCGGGEAEVEENKPTEKDLPMVSTYDVQQTTFEHYFEIQGAVEAKKNVLVVPEVGGLIKSIHVAEGSKISKGQLIATFDSKVIASNINELKEQLELAKYMYEKQKALYDQGVGTELALKQAEGQYKTLEQTLKTLNTQKGKFSLFAPFSGYVEQVFPVVGQMAGPTSPIIRLMDLSKVSVKANVSEAYLSKLNQSNRANVSFPALENLSFDSLSIKRIGKFINPVNRTVIIEVEMPKSDANLFPNLMAVLTIRDYVNPKSISIPSRTILRNVQQEAYVYVVKNDTVYQKAVELGQSYQNNTEVISGLALGDKVIDKGCRGVKEGDAIKVSNK